MSPRPLLLAKVRGLKKRQMPFFLAVNHLLWPIIGLKSALKGKMWQKMSKHLTHLPRARSFGSFSESFWSECSVHNASFDETFSSFIVRFLIWIWLSLLGFTKLSKVSHNDLSKLRINPKPDKNSQKLTFCTGGLPCSLAGSKTEVVICSKMQMPDYFFRSTSHFQLVVPIPRD